MEVTSHQLAVLLKRVVAYHVEFAKIGGGVVQGIFLSQACYWTDRKEDGWFYKTHEDWTQEIGITRCELETARKAWVTLGVLEEKKIGMPRRLWYRVNYERLAELLREEDSDPSDKPGVKLRISMRETDKPVCGKPADKPAGNQQTSLRETDKLECGKPADKPAENPQAITESTTESTTENSAESTTIENAPPPPSGVRDDRPKKGGALVKGSLIEKFERWWIGYPRKINKQKALLSFRKIDPDEELLQEMIASVEVWKRSRDWTREYGQFIPYPQTWLNNRRWEAVPISIEGKKATLNAQMAALARGAGISLEDALGQSA